MPKISLLVLYISISVIACKSTLDTSTMPSPYFSTIELDTVDVPSIKESLPYHPTKKRVHDLIHTLLEVSFDWEKEYIYGKATLTLTPYFYSTSTLLLDAKDFEINRIALMQQDSLIDLKYDYNDTIISIQLDKEYTRNDTFIVYIDYTAMPNKYGKKGRGEAISSNNGLYFINANNEDTLKPQQIWTQGEPESSSCWFPTIDAPNEKMTQEIYITVNEKFVTISNGTLVFSTLNGDSTRTDYWKQSLPHAPYLTALVVGDYTIVKDYWRDIEVNYYVEPKYAPYARKIFNHTPEMLEFFSKKLGVDYPWEKYSQVIVRDFVSGAMENTTVVVHGAFVQKTDRELLDDNNDDIVAHEMFHHWFGDLVTCESWANIPLNESFATYGEYLWREYKYGIDDADHHLQVDFDRYLRESRTKQENLIRYHYKEIDDVFDRHSYEKGGHILHYLRNYIGDDAFFSSINYYLTKHQFGTTEVHDLRLAFEKITGEDLNWFFDEWFFSSGHPDLLIQYEYIDSLSKQRVIIKQRQDLTRTPLYKLPISIDIYFEDTVMRYPITIDKRENVFTFDVPQQPLLVNVDADKVLPCIKEDRKPIASWIYQYYHAPLYLDRYEALQKVSENVSDSLSALVLLNALDDEFWNIRMLALKSLDAVVVMYEDSVRNHLMYLAQNDYDPLVRARAIYYLSEYFPINTKSLTEKNKALITIYREAVKDSSYSVIEKGLNALIRADTLEGLRVAKSLEYETSSNIIYRISTIYSNYGSDEQNEFFLRKAKELDGYDKYDLLQEYAEFLKNKKLETVNSSLEVFEYAARNDKKWIVKWIGVKAMETLLEHYTEKEIQLSEQYVKTVDILKQKNIEEQLDAIKGLTLKLTNLLEDIKNSESYKNMLQFYDD